MSSAIQFAEGGQNLPSRILRVEVEAGPDDAQHRYMVITGLMGFVNSNKNISASPNCRFVLDSANGWGCHLVYLQAVQQLTRDKAGGQKQTCSGVHVQGSFSSQRNVLAGGHGQSEPLTVTGTHA